MTQKKRILTYGAILALGILVFVLEIFVFQKPDGVLGYLICMLSIAMMFGGTVKLCKLSPGFKNSFLAMLDILFWLP